VNDPTLVAIQQDQEDNVAQQIAEQLTAYSDEFDASCENRHQLGAEKYGPGKFLMVDTLEEALDEIVDLANYARFTYIKLRMLQEAIIQQGTDTGVLGADGFMSTRDTTKLQKGQA
jgi:hypothetical protein